MQVSVETTSGLERRMTVEVPEERIEKEVQRRLQHLARTTNLKGFRPGKVPMKVVASRFGNDVRQEVISEVIQSTFYEAASQEKLTPAGLPQIEPKSLDAGKAVEYVATFEVMPEFEAASLDGVTFEKQVARIGDADLDKMLNTLREQRTEWVAVEREAKEGDRVIVDFKGTIDGEEFTGNEGKQVPLTLGGKRMIEGFEEGLTGIKAGEERTLDLTFPEEYANKELAGKAVQFAVSVSAVEEAHLPEIDDAFVAGFGVTEGGVEAFRKEVSDNMEREMNESVASKLKQKVMDKLIEINEVEIPRALIDNESQALARQMQQNMHVPAGKQGADLDPSVFEEQARRRVTLGLILSDLIKKNGLKASEELLRAKVESIAASYERPDDVVKWYFADRNRLGEIESLVLEDLVVDWVLENSEVTEVESSFDEIMNRG
jgi:trigger factor